MFKPWRDYEVSGFVNADQLHLTEQHCASKDEMKSCPEAFGHPGKFLHDIQKLSVQIER